MTNLRTDADNPETHRNRGLDTQAEESSNISVSLVDIDTAIKMQNEMLKRKEL